MFWSAGAEFCRHCHGWGGRLSALGSEMGSLRGRRLVMDYRIDWGRTPWRAGILSSGRPMMRPPGPIDSRTVALGFREVSPSRLARAQGRRFQRRRAMDLLVGSGGMTPGVIRAPHISSSAPRRTGPCVAVQCRPGARGLKIIGETGDDQTGLAVAFAGDFNNDGFDDLLSDRPAGPGRSCRGRLLVLAMPIPPVPQPCPDRCRRAGSRSRGECRRPGGDEGCGLGDSTMTALTTFSLGPLQCGWGRSRRCLVVFGRAQNPGALNLDNVALGRGVQAWGRFV